jgi:hypothetical protein
MSVFVSRAPGEETNGRVVWHNVAEIYSATPVLAPPAAQGLLGARGIGQILPTFHQDIRRPNPFSGCYRRATLGHRDRHLP